MFDIGWSEMAVVALIALIVIGPKDLPRVMRTVSHWVRKARGLAREFQSGIDDMIREADLADAKKALDDAKRLDFDKALDDTLDPTGEIKDEARSIETEARGKTAGPAEKPDESGVAPPSASSEAEAPSEEPAGATIVKQPLRVAPPHSVKPPSEDTPAVPASGKQAPRNKAPRNKAPRNKAPRNKAPQKQAPQKQAPQKQAPQKQAPQKEAPQKEASEKTA
jgi:sec-independent protein translocase protein TatB